MNYRVEIPKPEKKMKTVAKQMEDCIYFNNCKDCWLKGERICQGKLFSAALYYLRQILEKSERGNKNVSEIH